MPPGCRVPGSALPKPLTRSQTTWPFATSWFHNFASRVRSILLYFWTMPSPFESQCARCVFTISEQHHQDRERLRVLGSARHVPRRRPQEPAAESRKPSAGESSRDEGKSGRRAHPGTARSTTTTSAASTAALTRSPASRVPRSPRACARSQSHHRAFAAREERRGPRRRNLLDPRLVSKECFRHPTP